MLDLAFSPSNYESKLIEALQTAEKKLHEWVLIDDGNIIGHIAYTFAYKETQTIGFHLAPLAIHPDHQKKGYGKQLISQTLSAPEISKHPVFVLGDPSFYGHFGFQKTATPSCPFDPGNEHFLALRWDCAEHFEIGYEPEFFHL